MFGFTGNDKLAPPNPPSIGEKAINKKHKDLKQSGFDLGPAQGPHHPIDNKGLMRTYKNGRIYWSPQTGAHEVHGGILQKYIKQGETGIDPSSGKRFFGFPVTDEVRTLEPGNSTPVSYFQHGCIFWVKGVGAVSVYGNFYSGVRKPVAEKFPHDYPIADPIEVAGGQVLHFGHYSLFTGPVTNHKIIEIFFSWPQIGKPWILHPQNDFPIPVVVRVEKGAWNAIHKKAPDLLAKIIGDRYVLRNVGEKSTLVPIGAATGSPQISPTVFRDFPEVLIQTIGYLPNDAPELLKFTKQSSTKTKVGNQTLA